MYHEDVSLISIEELCEELNIGRNSAYTLLNRGDIKAFRIGRIWKIPTISVSEYIFRCSKLSEVTE